MDTYLRFSIGELSIVEAQYEFSPAQSDRNMLSLSPGDKVTVIGKHSNKFANNVNSKMRNKFVFDAYMTTSINLILFSDKITGDAQGWWKACNNYSRKIGYIPKDFVKVIQPSSIEVNDNHE